MTSAVMALPSWSPSEKFQVRLLVALRSFFAAIAIYTLGSLIDLGSSHAILALSALIGTAAATRMAFSRLTSLGFVLVTGGLYLVYSLAFLLVELLFEPMLPRVFDAYNIRLHCDLFMMVGCFGAAATWGFWRLSWWLTAELVSIGTLALYLLAGHRNYRFDSVKIINSLAWSMRVDDLTILVGFGAMLFSASFIYLWIATLPSRPSALLNKPRRSVSSGQKITSALLLFTFFAIAVGIVSLEVYRRNNIAAGSRLMNGVGEGAGEGLSPLGFHSALGATNQPAAVIRLEGDYTDNPYSPMLYIREQALSEFNGREMVIADRIYDRDTSGNTPDQPYQRDEDADGSKRVPLTQSVYLLADHKMAFAVDYPISIKPIKNPNPSRFKSAYQAISSAPAFILDEPLEQSVGDPNWNVETKQHYLTQHADPRYAELAATITKGITAPLDKVHALTQYINDNAIYTLQPNHQLGPNDDKVAMFLFGDMRGYCVHFAHALVYMMRSLGIPARIGTGYLTDLSQSKDGHILLRMSDRHAWSEVFVTGKGWVPFDVQPQRVESHAETPVDMNLLEELMGSLEPPEELLPKDIAKGEPGFEEDKPFWSWLAPYRELLFGIAMIGLLLPLGIKLYLRYGWQLPSKPGRKLIRSYLSSLSTLHDLGLPRQEGETRLEYQRRISQVFGADALCSTPLVNISRFSHSSDFDTHQIVMLKLKEQQVLGTLPWWRKMLAFLNPSSVFNLLLGGRW